jgi:L-alanine-DL-glutamate epimerase-like enolase superfamily enzyme
MELIREISLYRCPVRLKEPFVISLGRLEVADNVVVRVRTSGGLTGFGECSPFLTIHGENSDTAMAIGRLIAGKLTGQDALNIEYCSALMDANVYGNTSIKSAIDIALHDIAARRHEQPLYRFLGGTENRTMNTDYTVSIGAPAKMAADACSIMERGFPVIKVKLGGTEEEDVERMQAIRNATGPEIPIRIDANQGWSCETAIRILNKLESFNIQHCEEPVSRHSFLSLPGIRSKTKIPLMADESCFDDADAKRLIQIDACDFFNIKLGKSSGIFKAGKIVLLAEDAGIGLQAGGFLESRLGFTATAHLALSSNRFMHYDFDTPLMFTEDPVSGGIVYGQNGSVRVPEEPGLGAWIDDHVLDKLESIVVT